MAALFLSVIPGYDALAETRVSKEQWDSVKKQAALLGGRLCDAIEEADPWAQETFSRYPVFTILGI